MTKSLPTSSQKFWGILLLLFALILVLTLFKDWWLTNMKPNIWFYIFVPALTILGGASSMAGVAKICRQAVTFLTLLAISLGVNIGMQVVENILKIIYYRVWEYPGYLYLLMVLPLGFVLMVVGLVRWGKVSGRMAVVLAVSDFVGGTILGLLLTEVLGLTTPGS